MKNQISFDKDKSTGEPIASWTDKEFYRYLLTLEKEELARALIAFANVVDDLMQGLRKDANSIQAADSTVEMWTCQLCKRRNRTTFTKCHNCGSLQPHH